MAGGMSQKRYGEICRKVEDALGWHVKKSATERITKLQIVKGLVTTECESERIEISAPNATPETIGSNMLGNWHVDVVISYAYHHADVTREQAQEKASELFDLFLVPDINNQINNHSEVVDFAMYGGSPIEGESQGTGFEVQSVSTEVMDADTFAMTMRAIAYCRPSGLEV